MYFTTIKKQLFFKYIFLVSLCFSIFSLYISSCTTPTVTTPTTTPQAQKSKDVIFMERANEYALDGLFREAEEYYKKALSVNPDNQTVKRNLGIVELKSKQYQKSMKTLSEVEKYFSEDFDTHYYLGEAYRANNRYADAIFQYRKALSIKPDSPKVLKSLSWSYYNIKYYAEALKIAKKLVKLAPKDSQASIILSRIYLKTNKLDLALKVIQKVKKKATEETLPFYLSVEGDIYSEMKKYNVAIETYRQALMKQPLLPGALLGIGQSMLITGQDKSKAIDYIERALRIRPTLTEGYYILGKAYTDIDPQKSQANYKKFKHLASKDPEFLEKVSDIVALSTNKEEGVKTSSATKYDTNTHKNKNHNTNTIKKGSSNIGNSFDSNSNFNNKTSSNVSVD